MTRSGSKYKYAGLGGGRGELEFLCILMHSKDWGTVLKHRLKFHIWTYTIQIAAFIASISAKIGG